MKSLVSGTYRRSLKLAFRELDGTFVIVSPDTMSLGAEVTYFNLNEVGGDIWKRCDGTKVVEDIELLSLIRREKGIMRGGHVLGTQQIGKIHEWIAAGKGESSGF